MDGPCFTALPTEILEAIFLHLDPPSFVAVSQTNKLINSLTADAPVIWRHYCQTSFTTWDSRHHIADQFAGPLSDVDWRALYVSRLGIEKRTIFLLQRVVAAQHERIQSINEIADFGYDAKETLLRECACPDDVEDVLARRYYAKAALERIQREIAINVWKDLLNGKHIAIETALGAYDMFTRVGEDVHIDVVARDIDRLAKGVLADYPDFRSQSTRSMASTLALYLREHGFTGVSDASYLALSNSFIGLVLRSPTHESLPLISVAIYCAVAQRLGLDARPCGFRYHVYALVYAPKDYNLDGKYKPTNSAHLDFMYLDPFRSSTEVYKVDLHRVLREMGIPTIDHASYLSDASTREMVLRTAKNIMNSVQTIRQAEAGLRGTRTSWLHTNPDMDNAFYATIWAMLVLDPFDDPRSANALVNPINRRQQFLPYLLEHFQTHFPWDVSLLSRYVIPMFRDQPAGHRLSRFVQSMNRDDKIRKRVQRRGEHTKNVRFKVGQLFQHKRYYYEGVVTGWDVTCDAGEAWIHNMGVDHLPGGRNQAFYHVL